MLAKRTKWPLLKTPPTALVPPDLTKIGPVAFLPSDRVELTAWLSEEDWPREHMNIFMLEGYLAAMIVWPIELLPGAWMPPIWGTRGWKVAAKIAAPETFDRFVRLIVGYRQHLLASLNSVPITFVPNLHCGKPGADPRDAAIAWAQGFLSALQQGSQGFHWRTSELMSAAEIIIDHSQAIAPFPSATEAALAAELGSAVRIIASDRPVARVKMPRRPPPQRERVSEQKLF